MSVPGVSALLLTACGGLGFGGDAGGSNEDAVATAAGSGDGTGQAGDGGGNGSGGGGGSGNGADGNGDGGVARPNPTLENGERLFGDDGSGSGDDRREALSLEQPSGGRTATVGDRCGTIRSTTYPTYDGLDVVVREGTVDCERAMEVLTEYMNTPVPDGGGRMNLRDIGEWGCQNYDLRQAEEMGFQASCGYKDGSGSSGVPLTW